MASGELRDIWIARIKDYQASAERVATWCQRHQVTAHQLWYWHRQLRAEQDAPPVSASHWVALRVADTASGSASPLLVRVGSATVEVHPGFDPALLADVVRTLKSLC